MEEKKAKSEKVGVGAWIALIVLILILSGAFRTMDGPIKVLDFTNLSGAFGTIGDTGANLIGSGGTGAKDGFMAGFNLIPAVMLPACILMGTLIGHYARIVLVTGSNKKWHPLLIVICLLDAAISLVIMRVILAIMGIQ